MTGLIVRYDINGNILKKEVLGGSNNDNLTNIATDGISFYVVGYSNSNNGNAIIKSSAVPFALAGNPNATKMDNYANVEFQNVLIYNRALSENEVARNYQADMARY